MHTCGKCAGSVMRSVVAFLSGSSTNRSNTDLQAREHDCVTHGAQVPTRCMHVLQALAPAPLCCLPREGGREGEPAASWAHTPVCVHGSASRELPQQLVDLLGAPGGKCTCVLGDCVLLPT